MNLRDQVQVQPAIDARIELGFLFAVMRQQPQPGSRPEIAAFTMLDSPQEAIRAIRIQVRTGHVLGVNPREILRAVEWANSGWVQALAALHRGESCGFTILLGDGRRAEWSVKPTRYLLLSDANSCLRHTSGAHLELKI